MRKRVKLWILLFVIICSTGVSFAQSDSDGTDSPFSVGTDLVSRYIWRGLNLGGSSPSIQPGIEYGFGSDNHSFAIGAWGAYSLSGVQQGQEADLYLSYTFKELLSLTVSDYFFPDEAVGVHDYFNYKGDQTGHVLEAAIGFSGTEKIPVSVMFAMNVWGADAQKYEEQSGAMVATDGIVMSKYLELGYSTDVKGIAMDVFAGVCLDSPNIDLGEPAGFYGQKSAGLINLGMTLSKEVSITDNYSLPVFGSLITNPEAGNIFLVVGFSF